MNNKPKFTMDIVPTPEKFGWYGFLLFVIAIFAVIWIYAYSSWDFLVFIVVNLIFILGGFCGREFEKKHWIGENKKLKETNTVLESRLKELVDKNEEHIKKKTK